MFATRRHRSISVACSYASTRRCVWLPVGTGQGNRSFSTRRCAFGYPSAQVDFLACWSRGNRVGVRLATRRHRSISSRAGRVATGRSYASTRRCVWHMSFATCARLPVVAWQLRCATMCASRLPVVVAQVVRYATMCALIRRRMAQVVRYVRAYPFATRAPTRRRMAQVVRSLRCNTMCASHRRMAQGSASVGNPASHDVVPR